MIKKIYLVLLILAPIALQAQDPIKFDRILTVENEWLFFDQGTKAATGSDVVAERLAHEVFHGVGKPSIRSIGPHPRVGKLDDEIRDVETEAYTFKPLNNPKNAFAIEHSKTNDVLTAKQNGKIALEPYQEGNKRQQFQLQADTVSFGYPVYFKCLENGLVATEQDGLLKLAPQEINNQKQLFFALDTRYFDLVYEVNEPHEVMAMGMGYSMKSFGKHDKAKDYFAKAYELGSDNVHILELLGDNYLDYDLDKAAQFYDEAFELNKKDAEFCKRIGLKTLKANVENGLKYCRKANELKAGMIDFRELAWFHNGMAPVKYKDKYGVINLKGELLTKEWYDSYYQDFDNIMIPLKKDGKWRNFNNKGEFVGDWIVSGGSFVNGIVPIECTKDQWGVMDTTGQMVLPCKYKKTSIINDMILVENQEGKFNVLSRDGEPLTNEGYEDGWAPSRNPGPALMKDGKWRVMNSNGEFIKGEFKSMMAYTKGVCFVQNLDGKWGAIDTKGDIVLPYQYHGVKGTINGMAAIENKKGEFAVIDVKGNMLSDDWYDDAWVRTGNSMIALKKRKRWFYVSETQERVFRKCQSIGVFSEGYAFVKRWGKWGVINEAGDKMTGFDYDSYKSNFKRGRAKVEVDGDDFYINPRGQKVEKKLLEP